MFEMNIFLILLMVLGGRNCLHESKHFFKPSYVSDWRRMEAKTPESFITFYHNLNDMPMKVIADVKVKDGNEEYIFRGMGGAERDNDYYTPYGGVLVLYDEIQVMLFAPYDGAVHGKVIYAGSRNSWEGPNAVNRKYENAMVRVRVWKSSDFPEPSFRSNWTYVNTVKGSMQSIYSEVHHPLNCYPDFVNVQVKVQLQGREYIFEAQGSSSVTEANESDNSGTAVFGYSNSSVRIWFNYRENDGRVFSSNDGWGGPPFHANQGHFRVIAWKIPESYLQVHEIHSARMERIIPCEIQLDSMIVTAQVLEGQHAGYRFYGVGSAMNNGHTFGKTGGMIYAITNSKVLMWIPLQNKSTGYTFNIDGVWGYASTHQHTNNVLFRIEMIKGIRDGFGCQVTDLEGRNATHNITYNSSGIIVEYQCNFGYSHSDGNLKRTCHLNNTWSGIAPFCTLIKCPTEDLNTSVSTTLLNTTGNRYMDKATYTCSTNHRLIGGESYRYCQTNSTWSDLPLNCYRCRCRCINESDEQLGELIAKLKQQLTVNKEDLSSFIRKKISAEDKRPAAKGVGISGGIVLIICVVCLIISDLPLLGRHCVNCYKNIHSRFTKNSQ